MAARERRLLPIRIERVTGSECRPLPDQLAVEEPLEIQLVLDDPPRLATAAITMRTPGHDGELAAGFLLGEGLIRSLDDLSEIDTRVPRPGDQVRVVLKSGLDFDLDRLQRNFYATSSCGVCGKTSLRALEMNGVARLTEPGPAWRIASDLIRDLPRRLRAAQEVFERTGGLHAAGLFDREGGLRVVREDVGRHNAVDKVIGSRFLAGEWPLPDSILVVSGRASFELMQKALASGIPMLVAVGAPSSLAVEAAEHFGATLIGFTRAESFNIYAGGGRVLLPRPSPLPQEVG